MNILNISFLQMEIEPTTHIHSHAWAPAPPRPLVFAITIYEYLYFEEYLLELGAFAATQRLTVNVTVVGSISTRGKGKKTKCGNREQCVAILDV